MSDHEAAMREAVARALCILQKDDPNRTWEYAGQLRYEWQDYTEDATTAIAAARPFIVAAVVRWIMDGAAHGGADRTLEDALRAEITKRAGK